MALAKVISVTRSNFATLGFNIQTRGLVFNGRQVEQVICTKGTGDTTGSFDLSDVQRPFEVYYLPILDSAGSADATPTLAKITFTHTDYNTIAVSGLDDSTRGIFYVCGR